MNVTRLAGVNGTFLATFEQAPVGTPTMTIYSDLARTIVAVATANLTPTANPAVWTAAYPSTLAPANYPLGISSVYTAGGPTSVNVSDVLILVTADVLVGVTSLASLDDFKVRYEGTVATDQEARVLALLEDATGTVQDYTGQLLATVVDDTVDLSGNGERYVRLPQRPVSAVSSVLINGVAVADWRFDGVDALWRPGGWGPYYRLPASGGLDGGDIMNDGRFSGITEVYGDAPSVVTVTYSHGYPTVPAVVVKIVCALARREFTNPDGLRQEKIGEYSYRTDGPADGASMYLTESEQKSLDRFKRKRSSVRFR